MNWKLTFQVAATYVGAVMGAGFASGQEIHQFFTRFGLNGLLGICVTALLFSIMGWIILDILQKKKINSYPELFEYLFGKKWGYRIDVLVTLLLFVGMIAMLSGSGALFNQYFGMSSWHGIGLTSLIVLVALLFRGEGVLWINSILIPMKFIFCFGIALLALLLAVSGDGEGFIRTTNPLLNNWGISSILYVSFNLTFAMVVFASLGNDITKNGACFGGIVGGIALGLFAAVIAGTLLRFPEVSQFEIPMVAVAGKLGTWPAFVYMLVLWMAMITAAIGNAFSLVKRFTTLKKIDYNKFALILVLAVSPLAGIRFSRIVEIIYPIFGYIGLFIIPFVIYGWIHKRTN